MVGSVNKVTLIGNVGRDPEIRTTQDGRKIANIVLATSESWKDKNTGERREKTEWHRIVVFVEGLVNIIENYVRKGSKLYVEGALQTRKWVDNNNVERYSTEVILQGFNCNMTILDSRQASSASDSGSASHSSDNNNMVPAFEAEIDDDIPF